jgi:hypothetical protein
MTRAHPAKNPAFLPALFPALCPAFHPRFFPHYIPRFHPRLKFSAFHFSEYLSGFFQSLVIAYGGGVMISASCWSFFRHLTELLQESLHFSFFFG